MTIGLDATYSLDRIPTGIAVYSSQLIRALARSEPDERFLLCYRANRFLWALRQPLPEPNCSRRLLEDFACFLFRSRVAVFHGLNQRLPKCRFRRTVTTFHDLFVMTGDYSTPEFRERFTVLAKDAAERSDQIIAVSDYTARQVAALLHYPREEISVVHHGVEPAPAFPAEQLLAFRRELGLEAPFVLHVGALQARKNIERLVEAFEGMGAPYRLVLAGSLGYGAEKVLRRIERSPVEALIHRLDYVDRETLALLYRTAAVLAFPSLDEGFGLPLLEAMSAGLPVVTSDRGALPEVAGDAALIVDPENPGAIRNALLDAIEDGTIRRRLINAGLKRCDEFSWVKAAHETFRVYQKLV